MRPLLVLLLVLPVLSGCIVPKDVPDLKEQLGIHAIDEPVMVLRVSSLSPRVGDAVDAWVEGVPEAVFTLDSVPVGVGSTLRITADTPGEHVLAAVAVVDQLEIRDEVQIDVVPDHAPTLQVNAPAEAWVNVETLLVAEATDPDGDAVTVTWRVRGLAQDGTALQLTPTEPGLLPIEVTAVARGLADTRTILLPVNDRTDWVVNLGPATAHDTAVAVRPGATQLRVAATLAKSPGTELVRITLLSPDGTGKSQDSQPVTGASVLELVQDRPAAGSWTVRVEGIGSLQGTARVRAELLYG